MSNEIQIDDDYKDHCLSQLLHGNPITNKHLWNKTQ